MIVIDGILPTDIVEVIIFDINFKIIKIGFTLTLQVRVSFVRNWRTEQQLRGFGSEKKEKLNI